MGAGLHEENGVIHKATNADYENYKYNRVYAAVGKAVVINGEEVTLTKGVVLPITVRKNGLNNAGAGLDEIYLLGTVVHVAKSPQ